MFINIIEEENILEASPSIRRLQQERHSPIRVPQILRPWGLADQGGPPEFKLEAGLEGGSIELRLSPLLTHIRRRL